MNSPIKVLNNVFGYKSFREGQFYIISRILNKEDIFCILPTGAGKSICYQIPAYIFPNLTVVISPLIALMKDQVDNINNIGIKASYINSTQSLDEIKSIINKCIKNEIKLLYISPERLKNKYFLDIIKNLEISQVAIDEAHCVSMWGHDFRESYRSIAPFIKLLKCKPVITCFTATATNEVKEDAINLLALKNPYIYEGSFSRDNLQINIHKEEDKLEFIKDFLRESEEESGIIYCSTKKDVDGLYNYLLQFDFKVSKYHGGLREKEKEFFQEEFLNEEKNIMIATNAFGMGIDKSNIRYIIHFTLSKSLENYYQEIGRAGRDGELAKCHLLYNREDIKVLEYLIYSTSKFNTLENGMKKLQNIIDFCEWDGCYKNYILKYFGELGSEYCNSCSNCLKNDELRNMTVEAQKILSCIYRTKESVGQSVLIDILRGIKGPKIEANKFYQLSTFAIMKEYSNGILKDIIKALIENKYLDRKENTYSMFHLNDKSINILKGKEKVMLKLEKNSEEICKNEKLFKKLRILRKDLAKRENVKPYIIFTDSILIDISNKLPENKDELIDIKGLGEKKIKKYGMFVLTAVRDYKRQKN
ncbi:DNA helicase RecQ [Clostridium tarantellae]|uniref:DNA helicase RecQ n=1 Tax=Clostridium tarantellae TaxID=39493 RepID=A0A6I1MLC7_9CLOT|nr:DNA helicase RecQ [Clostridium tarantellae]MPQ43042.1 DNA helicase RecQ [Clostridium tarantellae]